MKLTRTFPAEAEAVGSARRFASGLVSDGLPELRETIELMVSELATNCVRHVNASFEVSIERNGDAYHVEVRDEGGGRPAMRSPSPEDLSGRGLRIVDLLAARWGVRYDANAGKTVWFTLTATAGSSGRQFRARKTTTESSARPDGRADKALTR
jgi:anti-sigma regulatory factor (Ser/Thr protein kinase)